METTSLRAGQVEIHRIMVDQPDYRERVGTTHDSVDGMLFPHHYMIKTFYQTDEEASGCEENRKAMLIELEGRPYNHNGEPGIYENVGKCTGAPREYALFTILIRSVTDIVVMPGDWDYDMIKDKTFGA